MLKLYTYQGCSTCRNALKWLKAIQIPFQEFPIRETPPNVTELSAMLDAKDGDFRTLCNTSGQDYRALGIKDKLPAISRKELLDLLSTNGNLIKRPFAIDQEKSIHLVGFKEQEWQKSFI